MAIIKEGIFFNKTIPYSILAILCIGTFIAILPTIYLNIDDVGMIEYFNNDEGHLMNLAWYYYSGQKRPGFLFENDYGLEILYITDFCRLVFSRFVTFTPALFVLILRWLNALFWTASFFAVWHLVKRHFGNNWQALLIVGLLSVRPALPGLCKNSKPDALVLFFMIVGLCYTLRIIDKPSRSNLYIAVSCAAIATVVKFAGIFLLPAIALALYLTHDDANDRIVALRKLKRIAWTLPAFVGSIFIITPLLSVFFYVRQSTGLTWYVEFGLLKCILNNKLIFYSISFGILVAASSFILAALSKINIGFLKRAMNGLNRILAIGLAVFLLFLIAVALFGAKWIVSPKYFITLCATTASEAFSGMQKGGVAASGLLVAPLEGLISKIKEFDAILFILLVLSIFMEARFMRRNFIHDRLNLYKRAVLFCFTLFFMGCMFLRMRLVQHHMLPLFAASAVLVTQNIKMAYTAFGKETISKALMLCVISVLFMADIFQNIRASADSFMYRYRQREDIAFDIAEWFRSNYDPETRIVADHPMRAYLPPEYTNTRFLKFQFNDVSQLRDLVEDHRPELVYYNTGDDKDNKLPPIEKILPGRKTRLAASFDASVRRYQKHPCSRFDIYRITY